MPILPSRDLSATLAFYERLGFENRGAPPEQWDYLIVGRGDVWLHFYLDPAVDPLTTSASCYVYVEDAQRLYDEWAARLSDDGFIHAPGTTFYGMIEWGMTDPDANALRVGGPALTESSQP